MENIQHKFRLEVQFYVSYMQGKGELLSTKNKQKHGNVEKEQKGIFAEMEG